MLHDLRTYITNAIDSNTMHAMKCKIAELRETGLKACYRDCI